MVNFVREQYRNIQKHKTQEKIVLGLTVLLLIAILLPLLAIAHYGVKCADDYGAFNDLEGLWQQTHSLWTLMKEQVPNTVEFWKMWQGTYFYVWFGRILMGICGDRFYFVGAYLAYASFLIGEAYLAYVLLCKILNAEKTSAVIITATVMIMQLLLIPAPAEAFYWFNSSILYMFPYGVSMLMLALCINLVFCGTHTRKKWILLESGILLATVVTGGSNYVSLILILVFFIMLVPVLWIRNNPYKITISLDSLFFLALALLNICAPGNQNRLKYADTQGYSAVYSVFKSLQEAAEYIFRWSFLPYIICGILLLPFFIQVVRKSRFKFSLPFLVTLASFGMFAAQFTPSLYSLGKTGALRIQNIYRITMVLWLYGNELYWTGYFLCKRNEGQEAENKDKKSFLLPGWCVGVLLLSYSLIQWGGSTVTVTSALQSIRTGQAERYRQEYEVRMGILEDSSIKEAYLPAYSAPPYLLYIGDISEDTENWINKSVADIYGKEVVGIQE